MEGLLLVAYWGGLACIGLIVNRLISAALIGAVWGGIFKTIGIAYVASNSYYGVGAGIAAFNITVGIVGGALVTSATYGLRRLIGKLRGPKGKAENKSQSNQ